MMKPTLYCFKIDEEKMTITRYETNDYQEVFHGGVEKILYNANLGTKASSTHVFTKSNLDTIVNMRILSFNPSIEKALKIANKYLISKREAAYKEYNKWNDLITHLNKNQQK